jgi:hypothetical protein
MRGGHGRAASTGASTPWNRAWYDAFETHPLLRRTTLVHGGSATPPVAAAVEGGESSVSGITNREVPWPAEGDYPAVPKHHRCGGDAACRTPASAAPVARAVPTLFADGRDFGPVRAANAPSPDLNGRRSKGNGLNGPTRRAECKSGVRDSSSLGHSALALRIRGRQSRQYRRPYLRRALLSGPPERDRVVLLAQPAARRSRSFSARGLRTSPSCSLHSAEVGP